MGSSWSRDLGSSLPAPTHTHAQTEAWKEPKASALEDVPAGSPRINLESLGNTAG